MTTAIRITSFDKGNLTQIPPIAIDRAPLLTRPYLADGSPLAAVFAHVPELLEATMPFIATVLGPSHLGERLKHLIVLRTSVVNGCRYCTRIYRDTAGSAGISAADVAAIARQTVDDAPFTSRERAAIAFVTEFCDDPAASVAPLKAEFRDDEIVALATIVGTTLFLNRFAIAMGLA